MEKWPILLLFFAVFCFSLPPVNAQSIHASVERRYGPFYFQQPIDHFNRHSVSFQQRYWANTDWYQEGAPVILYNAGEGPADERAAFVTNSSMALLARQLHGIVIVIEHRFYGKSMPSANFSVASLQTLNTRQSLEDMAYFIKKVELPNLAGTLPRPETKWIMYGGSYSGNLAAWMRQKYPHLVFAAVVSSAPVEIRYDMYQFFDTMRRYGPVECIRKIQAAVAHIDAILFGPFAESKKKIKSLFGVADLDHDDDFAELLTRPFKLWETKTPTVDRFSDEFCVAFDHATDISEYIHAYANYIRKMVADLCATTASVRECLNTHNPQSPMYTNITAVNRAWMWQRCTEYAYWQTAPPLWYPSIVSRKLTTDWYQKQCPLMFGEHHVPARPAWRMMNRIYKGWYISLSRVFWIDGQWDPWRTLAVNSDEAPDRSHWNEDAYYAVLPQSVHHWDFYVSDTTSSFHIEETHKQVHYAMSQWLQEA
ncbi:peptidase S28 [Radiomyces spectabilis]|uniref:peptidase S28 n=1 Tax=Radiomyces spectabilis TaxID=64574 RepID=UPI00221F302E|nr:peptidase S28 [Radiomyces spectabilis]KAI8393405.1 peptidase S28 [Radiomyces spectabilis]